MCLTNCALSITICEYSTAASTSASPDSSSISAINGLKATAGSPSGREFGARGRGQDALKQRRQFFLPAAGHQEIPKGAKAAALVGVGDGVALTHDLFQQQS